MRMPSPMSSQAVTGAFSSTRDWASAACQSSPLPMLIADVQGSLVWSNQAAAGLAHSLHQEVEPGQPLERLLTGWFADAPPGLLEQACSEVMTNGAASLLRDLTLRSAAATTSDRSSVGGLAVYDLHLAPLDTAEGQPGGCCCTLVEVTAARHHIAILERQRADLEQFFHIASHDLREPVRMLNGFLRLLSGRCEKELSDRSREFLAFAEDGSRRLSRMIEALLAFSRAGTRGSLETVISADGCAREAARALDEKVRSRAGSLRIASLPMVRGDHALITDVFMYLLDNALTFHGAHPPEVEIAARVQGRWCEISISDRGPGIAEKDVEQAFQLFQRLDTAPPAPASAGSAGAGAGLTIAKKIIERHGGQISLTARPQGGLRASFTLPLP